MNEYVWNYLENIQFSGQMSTSKEKNAGKMDLG